MPLPTTKLLACASLAHKSLNEITESEIAEYMRFLVSKQLSNATVNRHVAFLTIILRHARKVGLISRVPVAPRKLTCYRRIPHVFGEDEYHKWLDPAPNR